MNALDALPSILGTLAAGAWTAARIAAGALVIALAGGLALALLVHASSGGSLAGRLLRGLVAALIEWARNVPALAHLFLLYFGLASVGLRLSPMAAAILGLGGIGAATLCDVFVAALKSLHVGQREAALAAGLTPRQTLRFVLLPQMLRLVMPALANFASQLLKDTSLASAIAAPEIMFFARQLVTSTFQTPLIYASALALYATMLLPLGWALSRFETRLTRSRLEATP
ncbi:amino acid ABC transporter permease [Ideonella azotifigens]|uniref:ABC transmembrane type-1 domain-containing protein n=1 Tax=Ideonella azotifigens TaxID=513160 RepID=A0ABN1K9H5_9BURK|nr:amino acid ABC transporter permease [Ideonella azotifigens]MCD2339065.1 amino acid ABC transporter permease [Ideonella azotifigens]